MPLKMQENNYAKYPIGPLIVQYNIRVEKYPEAMAYKYTTFCPTVIKPHKAGILFCEVK